MGNVHTTQHLPTVMTDVLTKSPKKILARKMVKRQNRAAIKGLVKWVNQGKGEATWEFLYDLLKEFPTFEPCGQGSLGWEDLL